MRMVGNLVRRFVRDERGAALAEYAAIFLVLATAGTVILLTVGATLTEAGLNGSVFQMFAHGVMTGLFFALVGLVYEKAHSREIGKMGGFGRAMPGVATAFTTPLTSCGSRPSWWRWRMSCS